MEEKAKQEHDGKFEKSVKKEEDLSDSSECFEEDD